MGGMEASHWATPYIELTIFLTLFLNLHVRKL